MADENNTETENVTTNTDIFQQQKKTIDTLIEVLDRRGSQQAETVYVRSQPVIEKKSPNYLLYGGLALAALFMFKK